MKSSEARDVANEFIRQRSVHVPGGLTILDEFTIEKPYGWIFFYDSKRYIETRSLEDAIGGNGPLVVLHDGTVHTLGTAASPEDAISEFEQTHNLSSGPSG